jgi:hypothetical protein
MKKVKSTLSKASSYLEMGEYWDAHDLADNWDCTEKNDFEFVSDPQVTYFAVERTLSDKLRRIASSHGISADTMLNMWIQEKMMASDR